ncbi:hypothetical protein [Sulfurimonas sp.]|uniref:hypothetical protein n=1 Tax=Sulfurimonas sp. TaxID=2022749 RepID=UPI003D0A6CE2
MRKIVTLSAVAFLSTMAFADTDIQKELDALKKKIEMLEKQQKSTTQTFTDLNKKTECDNFKFGI